MLLTSFKPSVKTNCYNRSHLKILRSFFINYYCFFVSLIFMNKTVIRNSKGRERGGDIIQYLP